MPSRHRDVPEESDGQRLDVFLAQSWPDHSRSFWHRQITAGRVSVDGRVVRAGTPLRVGQLVEARFEVEVFQALPPTEVHDYPSWVVYSDPNVIVINKPRGLVVHPSAGHWDDSVVSRLLPWLPSVDDHVRPGVVHRLDRDTTGLMVLARTENAREVLSRAIERREVVREYVAVVRGRLDPPTGVIDAPLGRNPFQRIKMAVVLNGRSARTRYRTLAQWGGASFMQCTLETGRTHQIRVHLASLGHPVLGDDLYGGRHPNFVHGQLLHAGRLRFIDPDGGDVREFLAAPPEEWSPISELGDAEILHSEVFSGLHQPLTKDWLAQLGAATSVWRDS